MTNQEMNNQLYERMVEEQSSFRAYLMDASPMEILRRAPEYWLREDILLALEDHDLPDAQASALLKARKPLSDIYDCWSNGEHGRMDEVTDVILEAANKAIHRAEQRQKSAAR